MIMPIGLDKSLLYLIPCMLPGAQTIFFFKQKTAYEIGLGIPAEPLFRSWLETNNLFNNLIQRNQSAAFSSGKVRPNHETNINIIARRTGKDVNSHTVLDGIITTIMATIQ